MGGAPPRRARRLFHGHGRMQWPDGRMFLGQYVRNAKHGHGVFTWPDGREYAGQWCAALRSEAVGIAHMGTQ